MSRDDHGAGWVLRRALSCLTLPMAAGLVLISCADSETQSPPASERRPEAPAQAEMAPVPDFHRYVVGELPRPPVPDRDPFAESTFVAPAPDRAPDPVPTPAATTRRPAPGTMELRGIVQSQGRFVALVNDRSVSAGDDLAGWTVISVDSHQVVLEKNGRRRTLSL